MVAEKKNKDVGIIGMGFVGSYLASLVSDQDRYICHGYDTNGRRLDELSDGKDSTGMLNKFQLKKIIPTIDPRIIGKCDIIVVCVPTPLIPEDIPNLTHVENAMDTINFHMNSKKQPLIIIESSVVPGTCSDLMMKMAFYREGIDYFMAFSPERVMPGDRKKHTKIVSGNSIMALQKANDFYQSLGFKTHIADNMEVAEAAKLLENSIKFMGIQFMNQQVQLLKSCGIDPNAVIKCLESRDDTITYHPGLVGGHCLPVDYVYLQNFYFDKSTQYSTMLAEAGGMAEEVFEDLQARITGYIEPNCRVLIMGCTYKKDINDIRNSAVLDLAIFLDNHTEATVFVYDPVYKYKLGDPYPTYQEESDLHLNGFDIIIYAVDHSKFKGFDINKYSPKTVFDLTGKLEKNKLNTVQNFEVL